MQVNLFYKVSEVQIENENLLPCYVGRPRTPAWVLSNLKSHRRKGGKLKVHNPSHNKVDSIKMSSGGTLCNVTLEREMKDILQFHETKQIPRSYFQPSLL
jgi:hypothetical protein